MNLLLSFVIAICLNTVNNENSEPFSQPKQRTVGRSALKSDHEKELLKLVADKINHLLKDSDFSGGQDNLNGERDDRTPKSESEARAFETLAHVIVDASEQLQKPSFDRSVVPNVMAKHPETKSVADLKLYGGVNFKKPSVTAKAMDAGVIKAIESSQLSDASVENRDAEKPALKLTPRVVFTDNTGNEYRLVGAGGQSSQSCTGHCLRIDSNSKSVLAYKKPANDEHLILSDSEGGEYFTNGVQLCDDSIIKKSVAASHPPNLALLTPKTKLENSREKLSVQWEGEKAPGVKRENPLMFKEFSKDVNVLFNGQGLKNSPERQSEAAELNNAPHMSKFKKSRRRKHARLHRRRNSHSRDTRTTANDDYYYDEDDALVKLAPVAARTSMELKLLEDLKKDKKHLEEFGKKDVNSQVNMEKCKKHCEALSAQFEEGASKETLSRREKRTVLSNLDPESDLRPLINGKGFRVISIEPKERKTGEETNLGVQEEINMVQPESPPDVENRLLLEITGSPSDSNQGMKVVRKLDANDEEVENLPDLVPENEPDENVVTPETDDLPHQTGDSLFELDSIIKPNLQEILFSSTTEPLLINEESGETPSKASSAEIGSQFSEAILFRVQNTEHMKKTLGVGLKFHQPEAVEEPVPQHAPNYASTLQILLRTLMLNIEKIAEEDVQQRSCITLETDLQDFLDELLDFKNHPSMPNIYNANMGPPASYSTLSLRKNELLDLLREYNNLPLQAQQHAPGVRSFIETEMNDIDRMISSSRGKPDRQDHFITNNYGD